MKYAVVLSGVLMGASSKRRLLPTIFMPNCCVMWSQRKYIRWGGAMSNDQAELDSIFDGMLAFHEPADPLVFYVDRSSSELPHIPTMNMAWRRLVACLGLIGVEGFVVSPSLGISGRAGDGATGAVAPGSTPRRGSVVRVEMGTEFEDENAKEKLKAMLNRQFGIGDSSRPDEWCKPVDALKTGTVLLADPKAFTTNRYPKMLEKFGLAQPLPGSDQIPPDRAADLIPVVLLVGIDGGRTIGLMMNRRTGVLMGDLGDDFKSFMIQPLWLGGTQGENGITFIHTYPEVEGAQPISEEEGLFFSGDMESASRVVTDGPGSGFNFRFFAQITVWGRGELEAEVEKGLWRPAVASKMALLRTRDRKGPDVAKPMWADLSQMAGGEYLTAMEEFYRR